MDHSSTEKPSRPASHEEHLRLTVILSALHAAGFGASILELECPTDNGSTVTTAKRLKLVHSRKEKA